MQSPFSLGFYDNTCIYHDGDISKMPDFFSLLECKQPESRSHGKSKKGNIKRKIYTEKRIITSLKELSTALNNHGRHVFFSFFKFLAYFSLTEFRVKGNERYDRIK